jgi:hypothetical protein
MTVSVDLRLDFIHAGYARRAGRRMLQYGPAGAGLGALSAGAVLPRLSAAASRV